MIWVTGHHVLPPHDIHGITCGFSLAHWHSFGDPCEQNQLFWWGLPWFWRTIKMQKSLNIFNLCALYADCCAELYLLMSCSFQFFCCHIVWTGCVAAGQRRPTKQSRPQGFIVVIRSVASKKNLGTTGLDLLFLLPIDPFRSRRHL